MHHTCAHTCAITPAITPVHTPVPSHLRLHLCTHLCHQDWRPSGHTLCPPPLSTAQKHEPQQRQSIFLLIVVYDVACMQCVVCVMWCVVL